MTPWESVEANRHTAQQIGRYTIGKMEYTTLQGETITGKLWIENEEGEGMEIASDLIQEGVTEEWLTDFWKQNF
jgi:hypothetical protein